MQQHNFIGNLRNLNTFYLFPSFAPKLANQSKFNEVTDIIKEFEDTRHYSDAMYSIVEIITNNRDFSLALEMARKIPSKNYGNEFNATKALLFINTFAKIESSESGQSQ